MSKLYLRGDINEVKSFHFNDQSKLSRQGFVCSLPILPKPQVNLHAYDMSISIQTGSCIHITAMSE